MVVRAVKRSAFLGSTDSLYFINDRMCEIKPSYRCQDSGRAGSSIWRNAPQTILTEHLNHCRSVPSDSRAIWTKVWVRSCMQYVPPSSADRRLIKESIWSCCKALWSCTSEDTSLINNSSSVDGNAVFSGFKFEASVAGFLLLKANPKYGILIRIHANHCVQFRLCSDFEGSLVGSDGEYRDRTPVLIVSNSIRSGSQNTSILSKPRTSGFDRRRSWRWDVKMPETDFSS